MIAIIYVESVTNLRDCGEPSLDQQVISDTRRLRDVYHWRYGVRGDQRPWFCAERASRE